MSTVEKAAERLKTLQLEALSTPLPEATPAQPAPTTIERLQDRPVVTEQPAETAAPLLHVDKAALVRAGVLPAGEEASDRLADELRRVKLPLMRNAAAQGSEALVHAGRIMVTSALAGEGKTFTAMNLALSLARELDFEVVLVDGDIPKSHITRIFGLQGKPGLMDVLADEQRSPIEVIVRTDVPNLLVVPVGERHSLAAELFRSQRMEYVLREFAARNPQRLLVFDSSPLLAVSEAQVLASHMGQVAMVIAAGVTPQQAVNLALQGLDDSQYVGLILNMSSLPATENHYDSYYGQYSNGHGEGT